MGTYLPPNAEMPALKTVGLVNELIFHGLLQFHVVKQILSM